VVLDALVGCGGGLVQRQDRSGQRAQPAPGEAAEDFRAAAAKDVPEPGRPAAPGHGNPDAAQCGQVNDRQLASEVPLIGFARRLDPGLDPRDLTDVASRLDRMPDTAFAPSGSARRTSPGCGSGSRAGPGPDPVHGPGTHMRSSEGDPSRTDAKSSRSPRRLSRGPTATRTPMRDGPANSRGQDH